MPNVRLRRDRRPSVLLAAASDSMCCARIPAVLARAGIAVTVLAPHDNPALASRHAATRIAIGRGVGAPVRRLRALLEREHRRFDWIVLGDEEMLAAVAARMHDAWAAAALPVAPRRDVVEIVTEKTAFITACQHGGIATPRSRVCRSPGEALAAATELGLPLLLKANFGASGTTVWPINDPAHLMRELPRTAGQPFTLQQRIVGESGVTEMLCDRGRPIAIVSSAMRGIDPPPFGPASARLYRRTIGAETIAVRVAEMTGFHGFCGFDWIQEGGPDGAVHVLEFHARPTLGFHMARHAGVDFARAARRLLGVNDNLPFVQSARDTTCLLFPKDLMRACRRGDVRGLLRWLPGAAHHDLPWDDLPLARRMLARFAERRAPAAPVQESALPQTESSSVLTGF